MKSLEIISMFKDGSRLRRDFAKAASAFGVTFMTVPIAPVPMAFRPASVGQIWRPELRRSYLEKHEVTPNYKFWASEDEEFQKMWASEFQPDVMAPCTYELFKWNDADLLTAIDPSHLEYLDDLFPSLDNIEGSIING